MQEAEACLCTYTRLDMLIHLIDGLGSGCLSSDGSSNQLRRDVGTRTLAEVFLRRDPPLNGVPFQRLWWETP